MTLQLPAQPHAAVTVDFANPLARGLVGCWVITDDSLLPRNIANGVADSPGLLNGGAGLAAVIGSGGFALSQNGTSTGGIVTGPLPGLVSSEITVLAGAAFQPSNPASNSPLAISIGSVQGVDSSINLGMWDNQYVWFDMGNDYTYRPIPGGFIAGAPIMIGAVLNRDLSRALYVNGVRLGGEVSAKGLYNGNGSVALMQQRSIQTANTAMNGLFYFAYVWSRSLIPAEFALLTDSPYRFLLPAHKTNADVAPSSAAGMFTGAHHLSIGIGL